MAWYSIYSEAYAINLAIDTSIFSTRGTPGTSSTVYIWFGISVVALVSLSILYNWWSNNKIKRSRQKFIQMQDPVQQDGFDFSEDTSQHIESLAKAVHVEPDKLLSSNKNFEKAVAKLRKISPADLLLPKINSLRENLGYTFNNRRNYFVCTQMLPSGQKLRVSINNKGKFHSYIGTILNSNEEEFWVKPPTVKGKTVDLSKFKILGFSIFRKNDGEYRFTCRLKTQLNKPQHALVMAHVNKIKKLHIREYARYKLQFEKKFYFMVSDKKGEKKDTSKESPQISGTVVDISQGGLKFILKEKPENIVIGIKVLLNLEEAKIKQDVHCEIVKISSDKENKYIHLQFMNLSELNRLYLEKFITAKNPIRV